ncbi:MAG: hypothetical protein KAT05_01565 [Spirochaetes bacterium]|nr:hypothetical protein [Spirochaetota bacterium]
MEQTDIIQKITDLFADKLKTLSNKKEKIDTYIDDIGEEINKTNPIIKLVLLGIEEVHSQNMVEKIKRKGVDQDGNEIEYFVNYPSLFNIKYMVTPYSLSKSKAYKILGMIIKLIRDDGDIDINGFDWDENNGNPIKIEKISNMDLDKQLQFFNLLKMEYSPSLFYQLKIGINSDKKEIFKRVEKREIYAINKTEKK